MLLLAPRQNTGCLFVVICMCSCCRAFQGAQQSGLSHVLLHDGRKGSGDVTDATPWTVQVNEFFRKPVPSFIRDYLEKAADESDFIGLVGVGSSTIGEDQSATANLWDTILAPPNSPGVPRPLFLVVLASIPTGLVWYGYYKFCVEEELFRRDLELDRVPRGYGGYGTLGPFCYGLALGPLAELANLPGGILWSNVGIVFIYYTQFLLYDRVNKLYQEEGLLQKEPLPLWWTLPVFFPFNLIVGLRQVHYLSNYWYRQRGIETPPEDPIVTFFPFIGADRFTWQEFLTTPSLWCSLLTEIDPIKRATLPRPLQSFLSLGEVQTTHEKRG